MLVDAWAAYFDRAKADGGGELIEDDNFDLDQILSDLEDQEEDAEPAEPLEPPETPPPDDWEEEQTWEADPSDRI